MMKSIELSLEELRKISIKAACEITNDNSIDLIIYVARAGYPIALYMNEVMKCKMLGIGATRKGNKLKALLGPLVSGMPGFIRNSLIQLELTTKIHKKKRDRQVHFLEPIDESKHASVKNILIVDDSVDTGYSMRDVIRYVQQEFKDCKVITYALNVWDMSKEILTIDYCTYENTIIQAPMSKDSKEYNRFCALYEEAIQKYM
ncbi:MAG: phosphoribosyltransferase [Lachnospiraceae bacterium]|nr:phosphoribosyltransferase [Lachnospiraceae bacterium]